MPNTKREFRYLPAKELRVTTKDGKRYLSGYAAVYNSLSEDLGGWREKLQPGCFDRCLQTNPDIRCLRDHNPTFLMGRTKAQTLTVSGDELGLRFECELPNTTQADDLCVSVERGDVDGCSFGMYCQNDDWKDDAGVVVRTVLEADIFDVSVVTYPAYPATTVALRSMFPDGEVKAPEVQKPEPPKPDVRMNANGCDCDCAECKDDDCANCSDPNCDDPNCDAVIRMKVQLEIAKLV